ncbi:PHD finger protein 20-like protein 1 isoform X3 [Ptychodera flava]|uniref:PHD finger protein 20-like protein 1 isoform X3 n=1 Tax=Ptychodera flava TaxID=63121 RepID=UPI003969BD29
MADSEGKKQESLKDSEKEKAENKKDDSEVDGHEDSENKDDGKKQSCKQSMDEKYSVRDRKDSGNKNRNKTMLRPGINFKVGTKIEAMDYLKKWYPSKIVCVDEEDGQVLIHFEGWNQRYDEWVPFDSDRIRPIVRTSARKEKSKATPVLKYKAGEEVYARWTDCKYYPAKVLSANANGSYDVYFYDGFKKTVQPSNLKDLPEHLKSQELFSDMPIEIESEIERPRSGTPKKRLGSKDFNQGKKSKLSPPEPKQEVESRKRGAAPVSFQAKKARLDQITGKLASKMSTTTSSSSSASSSSPPSTPSSATSLSTSSPPAQKSENKTAFKNKSERLDHITGKLAHKAQAQAKHTVQEEKSTRSDKQSKLDKQTKSDKVAKPEKPSKTSKVAKTTEKPETQEKMENQDTHIFREQPPYCENSQPLLHRLYQEQQQQQQQYQQQLHSPKHSSVIASLLTQRTYPPSSTSSSVSGEGLYPPTLPPLLPTHPPYHIPHPPGMYGPLTSTGSMCLQSPPHSPYSSHYPMTQPLSPTSSLAGYHHHLPPAGMHDTPPDTPQYQSALMRMLKATSSSHSSTTSSVGVPTQSPTKSDNLLTTSQAEAAASAVPLLPMTRPTKSGRQRSASASQLHVAAELALELAEGRIRSRDKAKVIAHKETTIAPKELVIDLDHKKFKCDIQGCDKAFRKQSGLEYHKKYYHSSKSKARHQTSNVVSSNRQSQPSNKNSRRLSKTKKRLLSSSVSSKPSSSSSIPSSPSVTTTTDTVSIATATTTTISAAALISTATDTVPTTTLSSKSASLSSKSTHHKPSRIDRKKRSSAPASLPAAQDQIIKTPVSAQPPDIVDIIPEVNEGQEDKKEEMKEEIEKEETTSTAVAVATVVSTVQEEVKTEADVSMETFEDAVSREEIVHCVCNNDEEDGFMIQCETCLCWQHSTCVGLTENTVPKKYICHYCKNPAGQRSHAKYKYDQEWFKTGELPGFNCVPENYSKSMAASMLATNDLVGDMHVITDILHGLQQKIHILRTPNHPALHKWLKPWNKNEEITTTNTENNNIDINESEVGKVSSQMEDVKNKELPGKADDSDVKSSDAAEKTSTDCVRESDTNQSEHQQDETGDVTSDSARQGKMDIENSDNVTGDSVRHDAFNTGPKTDVDSLNRGETETGCHDNIDKETPSQTSDLKVTDSKENENIGLSSVKSCDQDSMDKTEEKNEQSNDIQEYAKGQTDFPCASEGIESCTDNTEKQLKLNQGKDVLDNESEGGMVKNTEEEVKDDVVMETKTKEEEDLEDMEVDVVNDDTTEDPGKNDSASDKTAIMESTSVTDFDSKQKISESSVTEENVKKEPKSEEVSDCAMEEGVESKDCVQKEESENVNKSLPVSTTTQGTETSAQKSENIEHRVSDTESVSGQNQNQSTGKNENVDSSERKEPLDGERTEQKTSEDKNSASIESGKVEGNEQADLKANVGNKEVLSSEERKDCGGSGGYHNKITPSTVKLTGSSVWTQVGRAKGSHRRRTESMRSERSEISEADVIESVEPLPPLVCEWNLIQHVSELESELDKRMDLIEQEIVALEASYGCPVSSPDVSADLPHLKRNMRRLLHDLNKIQELVTR